MTQNIVLRVFSAVLLCVLAVTSTAQTPNATKLFYDAVNQKWNDRHYAEVLVLINGRLQADPSDAWALMLKANYYIFAEKDIAKAHAAATSFLSVVNSSTTDTNLIEQAQAMAKRITDIPITDTTQFTSQQRDAMHAEFTHFPLIDESLVFWGRLMGQL